MVDKNKLAEREREIVALRTAWAIKAGYVWSRHIPYGVKAGLSAEEMEALKKPISAHPWSAADIALIKSADALCKDYFIPDDVWAELSAHFDAEQCIDAIFVAGHFVMLGMFLNAAGVQIDPDVIDDPDLRKL
jgi:alkylhydroperoxidase family enzyme